MQWLITSEKSCRKYYMHHIQDNDQAFLKSYHLVNLFQSWNCTRPPIAILHTSGTRANFTLTASATRIANKQQQQNLLAHLKNSKMCIGLRIERERVTNYPLEFSFFKYILLIMVLQLSHFFPLYSPLPCNPLPPAFPTVVHVHESYI